MYTAPVNLLKLVGMSSSQEATTMLVWTMTQWGYIVTLPLPLGPMGGYNYNDSQTAFIVDCHYFDYYLNTFSDSTIDCRETIRMIWNIQFYHGISFRPSAKISKTIRGLSIVFYLHDFSGNQEYLFRHRCTAVAICRLKLSVHSPGTRSEIQMAEGIGPGSETLVHISQTAYTRLPKPYGNCTNS